MKEEYATHLGKKNVAGQTASGLKPYNEDGIVISFGTCGNEVNLKDLREQFEGGVVKGYNPDKLQLIIGDTEVLGYFFDKLADLAPTGRLIFDNAQDDPPNDWTNYVNVGIHVDIWVWEENDEHFRDRVKGLLDNM